MTMWIGARMGDVVGLIVRDEADHERGALVAGSDSMVCLVTPISVVALLQAHKDAEFVVHNCASLMAMARRCGTAVYEAVLELVYSNRLHDVGIAEGLLRLAINDDQPGCASR
jgi:hypothetical protein